MRARNYSRRPRVSAFVSERPWRGKNERKRDGEREKEEGSKKRPFLPSRTNYNALMCVSSFPKPTIRFPTSRANNRGRLATRYRFPKDVSALMHRSCVRRRARPLVRWVCVLNTGFRIRRDGPRVTTPIPPHPSLRVALRRVAKDVAFVHAFRSSSLRRARARYRWRVMYATEISPDLFLAVRVYSHHLSHFRYIVATLTRHLRRRDFARILTRGHFYYVDFVSPVSELIRDKTFHEIFYPPLSLPCSLLSLESRLF